MMNQAHAEDGQTIINQNNALAGNITTGEALPLEVILGNTFSLPLSPPRYQRCNFQEYSDDENTSVQR